MKFVSWNVNGLRAVIKKEKGFFDIFDEMNADFFMKKKKKMQESDVTFLDDDKKYKNYYVYMSSAEKKGYSGTLIFSKIKPNNVVYGINGKYNDEGRAITLEFDDFYLILVSSN